MFAYPMKFYGHAYRENVSISYVVSEIPENNKQGKFYFNKRCHTYIIFSQFPKRACVPFCKSSSACQESNGTTFKEMPSK